MLSSTERTTTTVLHVRVSKATLRDFIRATCSQGFTRTSAVERALQWFIKRYCDGNVKQGGLRG